MHFQSTKHTDRGPEGEKLNAMLRQKYLDCTNTSTFWYHFKLLLRGFAKSTPFCLRFVSIDEGQQNDVLHWWCPIPWFWRRLLPLVLLELTEILVADVVAHVKRKVLTVPECLASPSYFKEIDFCTHCFLYISFSIHFLVWICPWVEVFLFCTPSNASLIDYMTLWRHRSNESKITIYSAGVWTWWHVVVDRYTLVYNYQTITLDWQVIVHLRLSHLPDQGDSLIKSLTAWRRSGPRRSNGHPWDISIKMFTYSRTQHTLTFR